MPARSVIIHGHFYQPPRADPWTGVVPEQPSAAPDHDWNARIERECYGPVTRARFTTPDGDRFMNTLEHISFNFGPTLLSWMESAAPATYGRVLEADVTSRDRLGHGNAIAQAYHHTILPLATLRDKRTEVRWGILDFERRFGRKPEGMWLPETAADAETLDVLGDEGIQFVVLAPHQVDPLPADGSPGWFHTAGGARVALFAYDGGMSHDVAFGDATRDAEAWAQALATETINESDVRRLVTLATDGETYGHHKEFAELGLAATLHHLETRDDVVVENFASFLATNPPTRDVDLVGPASWSCAHGVERWRSDCGCKLDPGEPSQQAWRAPLRLGLEQLATRLHALFSEHLPRWMGDPWSVRDAYGGVFHLVNSRRMVGILADTLGVDAPVLSDSEVDDIRRLLEMERNALSMFTSCAWFFDDVVRVEPEQVLKYAERAIELSGESEPLRRLLFDALREAKSNDPMWRDAAHFYESRIVEAAMTGKTQ